MVISKRYFKHVTLVQKLVILDATSLLVAVRPVKWAMVGIVTKMITCDYVLF